MSRKAAVAKEQAAPINGNGSIVVRPMYVEVRVVAELQQDGKAVDMAAAADKIMEAHFDGVTVAAIVEKAQKALEEKIAGGG